MSVELKPHSLSNHKIEFLFEGVPSTKFAKKIEVFLEKILHDFPWIRDFDFFIESSNTFPHSSGIASSASSMSALALCLLSLDCQLKNIKLKQNQFLKLASSLARKASGSASRSLYPHLACWGKLDGIEHSSDEWAIPFQINSETFLNFCDSIIIVDASEKAVSSRIGHELMNNHPFKEVRFLQARQNLNKLVEAIRNEDLNGFIEVVEDEALTLHAMMMTSKPSYILLKPSSLLIIEKVREFRNNTKLPICFTIDAGPNIHLLYPKTISFEVEKWMVSELLPLLGDANVIYDHVGSGPVLLSGENPFE